MHELRRNDDARLFFSYFFIIKKLVGTRAAGETAFLFKHGICLFFPDMLWCKVMANGKGIMTHPYTIDTLIMKLYSTVFTVQGDLNKCHNYINILPCS